MQSAKDVTRTMTAVSILSTVYKIGDMVFCRSGVRKNRRIDTGSGTSSDDSHESKGKRATLAQDDTVTSRSKNRRNSVR